jgi:hypothetical protein
MIIPPVMVANKPGAPAIRFTHLKNRLRDKDLGFPLLLERRDVHGSTIVEKTRVSVTSKLSVKRCVHLIAHGRG